jgi:hypothetical protein
VDPFALAKTLRRALPWRALEARRSQCLVWLFTFLYETSSAHGLSVGRISTSLAKAFGACVTSMATT